MNKRKLLILLSLSLAWSAAPATETRPAPWMVAQSGDRPRPTCESDKRKMPRGSMVCRDGKRLQCGPYGNWIDTGKEC
jgi:hypothetical protein